MELLPRAAGAIGLVPISAPPPGLVRVDSPQSFGPFAPLQVPDSWKGKKPAAPVKAENDSEAALDELVRQAEELGLYESTEDPVPVAELPPVRRKKG